VLPDSNSDIHLQFLSQGGESLEENALLINGRGYPASAPFGIEWGESRANIPKLREYCQIRPEYFGLAAGLDSSY